MGVKMIKKTISLLLILLMVFSIIMPTDAFGAGKDYSGHWAEKNIQSWLDNNYGTGYPDGSFRPEGLVTRAEFVKMVNALFGYTEITDISFTDVKSGDWYYKEVQKAVKANYITGVSKTKFAPNESLTREQAAVIISKIMKLKSDPAAAEAFTDRDKISSWAKEYVGAVVAAGLFKGYDADNSFRPQNSIKRAEAIVALDRTKKLKNETDSINKHKNHKNSQTTVAVTSISAITGIARVGVELTAGTLTPTEATINYQWKICGTLDGEYTDISGATTNKYIPVTVDASKYIKISATGTGNYTGTVTSAPTAAVAPIETYTVTFDSMGGTTMTSITGVVSGTAITLPSAPTKTEYIFAGWNTEKDGSGTTFDVSTKVTANVTVYAQWTVKTYTVTFDSMGGTTMTAITGVLSGTVTTLPTAPTKAEYIFEGWNTEKDGSGTTFDVSTKVTANVTVYALWTAKTYTVTFDSMGGTTMTAITGVVSGTEATLPAAPAKKWYIFAGWNTAADGSGTIFDSSTKVTANVTVYAQWTPEITKIKFPDSGTAYIGYEDLPDGDLDYDDVGMNMSLEETYEGGVLRKVVLEYKLLVRGAGYNHLVHINRPLKGSYTYTIDRDIIRKSTEVAETTSASGIGEFDVILFDSSDATPRTIKIEINFDAENTANTLSDYEVADARFDLDEVFKLYDPWIKIKMPDVAPDVHIRGMIHVPAKKLIQAYDAPCIIVVPVTDWFKTNKIIPMTYPNFDDYYRTKDPQYSGWYN